jgi:3-hydroxyacyl-CoA dehydrogenase
MCVDENEKVIENSKQSLLREANVATEYACQLLYKQKQSPTTRARNESPGFVSNRVSAALTLPIT